MPEIHLPPLPDLVPLVRLLLGAAGAVLLAALVLGVAIGVLLARR